MPVARIHSALAGQPASSGPLINVARLVTAYFSVQPDPTDAAQRVVFGTSGHRGSAFDGSFNEWHVLAITQAVCDQRRALGIDGPLFLGIDTHALSEPARASAMEVLAANGVEVMLATNDEYTPTPVVSHAILRHNAGLKSASGRGQADGIIITPSHNPPRDGGYKYNPPQGGPASDKITTQIEVGANRYLDTALRGIRRVTLSQALRAPSTHRHDFLNTYVPDLSHAIDMEAIRSAGIHMGVDPMGGAGVHYWGAIAAYHRLNLTVISQTVDSTFQFMTRDWDGQIRMDPSSPYAMRRLTALKGNFDIAFACDTDHDRHGIVTPTAGLMTPNHYLSVAIDYLFRHRPQWRQSAGIGKTVVSTQLIDRIATRLGLSLFEVPVGFKWYSQGLFDGSLGFAGEESGGASFARRDGSVWTTDKDGISAALLSGEITARSGRDPGALYSDLTQALGHPVAQLIQAAATPEQKKRLAALTAEQIATHTLAGESIVAVLTRAPGNGAAIGGIRVNTANGWFAARPSGTEDIYKIYAESFNGPEHLERILQEAQAIVDQALAPLAVSS
jgi:phosphoglucomutase